MSLFFYNTPYCKNVLVSQYLHIKFYLTVKFNLIKFINNYFNLNNTFYRCSAIQLLQKKTLFIFKEFDIIVLSKRNKLNEFDG
jgi:hypothetical protein